VPPDTVADVTTTSTTYVALLRGINVGGKAKVPMQTLRELLAAIGGTGVRTHLQSGNALFSHEDTDPARLAEALHQALADELGLDITCMVRTAEDLRRVVAANPFDMTGIDGSRFLVVFLTAPVPRDRLAVIEQADHPPDELRAGEREIYAHFPDSIRNSKLAARLTDRGLGTPATSRNWNTVTKLLELADA
jgi:uncharacterized protein (DUF1697 family)